VSLFDEIRQAAAYVARNARAVHLVEAGVEGLTSELAGTEPEETLDPARSSSGDEALDLAYAITMNAINFGSGWFPVLRKRPGCSGYLTLSAALAERFEKHGPWSARELVALDGAACVTVFDQEGRTEAEPLMGLYAEALRALGSFLERWDGRFSGPVEEADGSGERLVTLLAEMPFYRDVASHSGRTVPFYKRAQITVSDLAETFGGEGWGRFRDLDSLTMFADNLVPHTLRMKGVLRLDPALAGRIERGETIESGSPEEVEIRALGVHAVERLVASLRDAGVATTAHALDHRLWDLGQSASIKSVPRHRTRCTFY
jgi:hypothetical protein